MSDWRIRGYVPDSDEEEDILNSPTTVPRDEAEKVIQRPLKALSSVDHSSTTKDAPVSTSPDTSNRSTAQQLERILSHGLQTVRDVLAAAPTASRPDGIASWNSGDESPLSSPPSSAPGSPARTTTLSINLPHSVAHIGRPAIEARTGAASAFHRRGLRARAPIQEHPYMLEDAQYRQLMKDRGLRPVNTPIVLAGLETSIVQDESQQTEDSQGLHVPDSLEFSDLSRPSSPIQSQGDMEMNDTVVETRFSETNPDDGLPDLSAILRERKPRSKKTYRVKARPPQLAQPLPRAHSGPTDIFDIPEHEHGVRELPSHTQSFRVPPSPPRSENYLTAQSDEDEDVISRRKPGRNSDTPVALPTPLMSSDLGNRKRPMDIFSGSESPVTDDDKTSTSSESTEDDSQGLRWIKNRLRGVLPPSFLKLNAPRKPEDRSKQPPPSTITPVSNERGVARRTTASRVPAASRAATMQLLQSESSDSDEMNDVKRYALQTRMISKPLVAPTNDDHGSDFDDVVEDNEIDRMLPSIQRRRGLTQPRRQRQARVDDGWAVLNRRSAADAIRAGLTGQGNARTKSQRPRAKSVKRRKSGHRPKHTVMNVSDAPGLHEVERKLQPRFLRVAARQAKRITYEAEYSPQKKFFQLATEEDTRELEEQLRTWGKKPSGSRQARRVVDAAVFSTRPGNSTSHKSVRAPTTQINPTADLDKLRRSTKDLLSKLSGQDTSLTKQKHITSSTPAVDPTAEQEYRGQTARLRSIFAHRNRSGRGEFLSRPPEPRAAQVESELLTVGPVFKVPVRTIFRTSDRPRVVVPDVDLTEPQARGVISENSSIKKFPRKQIPKKHTIPTSKMTDPMEVMSPSMQDDHAEPDLTQTQRKPPLTIQRLEQAVEPVLRAVRMLHLHPRGTRFSQDGPVGGKHLRKLSARFSDKEWNPLTATGRMWYISAPISHKLNHCGQLDDSAQSPVQGALSEVHHALFSDEFDIVNNTELYEDCTKSLTSIVSYLEVAISFLDETSLLRFVEESEARIQDFLAATLSHCDHSRPKRQIVLSFLNWLAIIAAYLYGFSSSLSNKSDGLNTKVKMLYKVLVRQILDVVYDGQTIQTSLVRFQELFDPHDPLSQSISSFPEADSVVIAWHLMSLHFNNESPDGFYQDFKARFAVSDVTSAYSQLRSCLLALCFTLPLLKISIDGDGDRLPDEIRDDNSTCFLLLATQVENVAKNLRSGEASRSVGQLLEAVEDVSLKMAKTWLWTPPPGVVTALLKAYAWNAWLPFSNVSDADVIIEDLSRPSKDIHYRPDNDFYKFLELAGLCMESFCLSRNDSTGLRDPGKIRGFVFSLLPNNAWSFDAQDSIPTKNLVAFKNYAALHIKIFESVPDGFQPRLQDMKYHVNFVNSHSFVCKLAAAAWKRITLFYIRREYSDHANFEGANVWMESMLQQSITFLENKPRLLESIRRLEDLLTMFVYVLQQCDTELKSRLLLSDGVFDSIQRLLESPMIHGNNDDIMTACLKLLSAYANTVGDSSVGADATTEIQLILKKVIQNTLGSSREERPDLTRILIETWFVIAHHTVRTFHRNWNDFMDPHSGLSIDFLSGQRDSYVTYDAKQMFYSHLFKVDKDLMFLEYRPIVFTTWIATLLVPVQSMRFEPVLTNTILTEEKDSLMIRDLARLLFEHDGNHYLTKQQLADSRIVILRHIIQNIHDQQACPEEEWLAGGLDAGALRNLLRTMASTMKNNWLALKYHSVEQSDYTALVHAVLNEMETHPIPGFKIDPWFTGASEFPRQIQTLYNVFTCRFGTTRNIINKDMVRTFIRQYLHGIATDQSTSFVRELLQVFHCTDPVRSRVAGGIIEFSIDFVKQAKLLQIVVPAFIECASEKASSGLIHPLLEFLTGMTERLPYRIDDLNEENMARFVEMTASILCSVRMLIEEPFVPHVATAQAVKYTRVAMATVFSLIEYGIPIAEDVYELCVGNILGIYAIAVDLLPRYPEKTAIRVDVEMTEVVEMAVPDVKDDASKQTDEDRKKIVYDGWTEPPAESIELMHNQENWASVFEATEPKLDEEGKELRRFAVEELKGWAERIVAKGGDDTEELREAMLGLVRDLKARDLVEEEDE